jgi:NAD(P)-dependent dehydrogenase (short-subunit alcohol dehydrogenase family)
MALKVWFITGASKGFGLEISRAALAAGDAVVATARDPKSIVKALGNGERLLALHSMSQARIKRRMQLLPRLNVSVSSTCW